MSTKQNNSIRVDREQVETITVYTEAVASEMTRIRGEIFPPINYMLSDDEISGGDFAAHKTSMEALLNTVTTVEEKCCRMAQIMRNVCVAMGSNASAKKLDLSQAKEAVVQAKMKMSQAAAGNN